MNIQPVDIVNRALQILGTRTTVSAAEFAQGTSNEAIQAAILYNVTRDNLSCMAPWDGLSADENLVYISSAPGTPENQMIPPLNWQNGLPPPPWLYEYAYPPDCLRPIKITPALIASGPPGTNVLPIPANYPPPILDQRKPNFKLGIDKFYPVTGVKIAFGGSGYVVGEILTLASSYGAFTSDFSDALDESDGSPAGAPVQILVNGVDPTGAITNAQLFPIGLTPTTANTPSVGIDPPTAPANSDFDFNDTDTQNDFGPLNQTDFAGYPYGGYFRPQMSPQGVGSTTGVGVGASFNLSFSPRVNMRVIYTNQPNATLTYVRQIVDPNLFDPLFVTAWCQLLAAGLAMALLGDKQIANGLIQRANAAILQAREQDATQGFDVWDVMPDWLTVRGGDCQRRDAYGFAFNWGALWPSV